MKKYLLTLCLTMLAAVSSWAQWAIDVSTAPIYVEVNGHDVGAGGNPNEREFTITTPTDASGYTVEAVEVVAEGKTAGQFATAAVAQVSGNNYKVTFSPVAVGITRFYLQIKQGGTVVSSTAAMPFEVNVFDMTKARYLINPGDLKITKSTTEVVINFAPVTAATSTAGTTVASTASDSNTGTLSVGTSLTTKDVQNNLVSLSVNASSADEGDKITVTITPPTGSVDRNGNDVQPVTFTLTVDKPEFPITYPSLLTEYRVGENWTSTLNAPAGSEYEVEYSIKEGYPEDVIDFVWNESDLIHSSLTTKKVGQTQIWTVITPKCGTGTNGENWADYRAWERPLDITVREALLQPILTAAQGTGENVNKWTPSLAVNIDPNNNGDGNAFFTGALSQYYTVSYSLEGEIPETAEVDPVTGVVTVSSTDAAQTFYLVATVVPKNPELCLGGTARAPIIVTGSLSQGAYLYRNTVDDWTAYTVDPDGLGDGIFANYHIMDKNTSGEFVEVTDADTKAALLQQFKDATTITVKGTISNLSIVQLAHAIGTDWGHVDADRLKTLDMSGCIMVDRFDPSKFPVNRNDFTENPTSRNLNFVNVKKFVLPMPAIGVENGTVLPAEFNRLFTDLNTNSYSNIESLVIPEGWTEIENNFSRINSIWGASPYTKLTELKLPNSMEKIGAFAFSGFAVKVLTMPYNIHRINEGAFATSPMLQDVYFTGPAPEFVHTLAFSGVTQMCNNTVKDDVLKNKVDPEITRYEYYNGTTPRVYACILHFPEQYRSYYTDVTREYKRLTKEEVDAHNAANPGSTWNYEYSKGYKLYVPDGWTPAFIQQVRNKKIDYNAYVSDKVDYGAKDAYYGLDMIWPSQNQMSTGFAIAQAGYQWSGQPLRTADQYNPSATYENTLVDRRGLYQFIIAMDNADIHFEFELGKWYTIALPFDMTPEQIKKAFGPETQVCRFSKVTRVTGTEPGKTAADKLIKLEFRKSVMGDVEKNSVYDGTNYASDYEHPHDAEGADTDHDKDYYVDGRTGIIHHFPYMIKPSGAIVENEYVSLYDGKYHFNSTSFPRITGTIHPDIRRTDGVIKSDATPYAFTPILSTTKIKPNSYVLVNKDGDHKYAFYKGVEKGGVYVAGGKARQNTSYIQLSEADGKSDYDTFFDPDALQEAKVYTFYADDEDDAPTAVEKVVIVCGQDGLEDNIVYTINGVRVNGDSLPAGLYIKNGKKFIVK